MKKIFKKKKKEMKKPRLFLALDLTSRREVLSLVEKTSEFIDALKVGPELFLKQGPSFVKELCDIKPVFLDLKHFDIPVTVEKAVREAFFLGVRWVSVHALNGRVCMKRLKKLLNEFQKQREFDLFWVTILTSFSLKDNPFPLELNKSLSYEVLNLAKKASEEGFSHFVCSAEEASLLRSHIKDSFLLTPAVRFQEEDFHDQKRVVHPREALKNGASAFVVGRAISQAKDPKEAARKYYEVF